MAVSLSNVACTLGSKDSGHGRRARRVWSCRTVQQLPPRIAFEVERGGHIEELGLVSPTQRAVDGTTFAQKSTLYNNSDHPAWLADDKEPSMRDAPGFLTRVQTEFAVQVPR